MYISSLRFALPCCNNIQEEQTQCSLITRVIACALGVIALTLGISILVEVPILCSAGFIVGGLITTAGIVLLLVGGCIKSVRTISSSKQQPTENQENSKENLRSNINIVRTDWDPTGDKIRRELNIIRKELDFRGGGPLTTEVIDDYFIELAKMYPTFKCPKWGTRTLINDRTNTVKKTVQELLDAPQNAHIENFAFPLLLSGATWSHFTLVFVDYIKRTVEFYDNVVKSANHIEVMSTLTEVAKMLSEKIPATSPFKLECPITQPLLGNGHDCGFWIIYFLENRLKNAQINFNNITVTQGKEIMLETRKRVAKTLVNKEIRALQKREEIRKQKEEKLKKQCNI